MKIHLIFFRSLATFLSLIMFTFPPLANAQSVPNQNNSRILKSVSWDKLSDVGFNSLQVVKFAEGETITQQVTGTDVQKSCLQDLIQKNNLSDLDMISAQGFAAIDLKTPREIINQCSDGTFAKLSLYGQKTSLQDLQLMAKTDPTLKQKIAKLFIPEAQAEPITIIILIVVAAVSLGAGVAIGKGAGKKKDSGTGTGSGSGTGTGSGTGSFWDPNGDCPESDC